MTNNIVWQGTELKLNIHIDPIDGQHMNNYNWKVIAYCNTKNSIMIPKDKAIPVESSSDNYIVCIDTSEIGTGNLMIKVIAYIKDEDFEDKTRTEVSVMSTGINIVKG